MVLGFIYLAMENIFYESIEGNAIMFPSNTLHGGTGAPHHKQRWCLNVMFESDFKRVEVK